MGALYQITFPNGKSYIGITSKSAKRRFASHCSNSKRTPPENYPLYRALRATDQSAVKVQTLLHGNWDYLQYMERKAIAAFGTKVPHGYNVTEGGEGALGRPASDRQKAAVSAALKGKTRSPEHSANIAKAKIGTKHTEEAKRKIGAWGKGRTISLEARERIAASKRGKPRSAETKAKLAEANLGKKASPETKLRMKAAAALRAKKKHEARGPL